MPRPRRLTDVDALGNRRAAAVSPPRVEAERKRRLALYVAAAEAQKPLTYLPRETDDEAGQVQGRIVRL